MAQSQIHQRHIIMRSPYSPSPLNSSSSLSHNRTVFRFTFLTTATSPPPPLTTTAPLFSSSFNNNNNNNNNNTTHIINLPSIMRKRKRTKKSEIFPIFSSSTEAASVQPHQKLLISSRNLEFFTNGYRYLIQILPAAVVAPMFFSGKIEFGVINQSVSAFNHILGDFSLIVYQFQAISAFSAVIDRLGEFDDFLDSSNSSSRLSDPLEEEIRLMYCSKNVSVSSSLLQCNGPAVQDNHQLLLHIDNLNLQTPLSKGVLIRNLSLAIYEKDHLLITGPSGSGKTSLLRAVAGLWSTGNGEIKLYVENLKDPSVEGITSVSDINEKLEPPNRRNYEGVFFLPQRPYMVLGTLRQQLLYPTWTEDSFSTSDDTSAGALPFLTLRPNSKSECLRNNKPTTDDLIQVLEDVRLSYILSRSNGLDSICEWSSVLSLGEQQRLAFARVLLSKPYLLLLDESTSALDEANEAHLYQQLDKAGITYVSIGHRRTLYKYHNKVLRISNFDPLDTQQNWSLESVIQDPMYDSSRQ